MFFWYERACVALTFAGSLLGIHITCQDMIFFYINAASYFSTPAGNRTPYFLFRRQAPYPADPEGKVLVTGIEPAFGLIKSQEQSQRLLHQHDPRML